MKREIKALGKKSLITTKKFVAKNKHTRHLAKLVINALELKNESSIYDALKFYPQIPEYMRQIEESKQLKLRPLISIVMPTYNTDIEYLKECIESVITQSYDKWELCIADDASPNPQIVKTLQQYAAKEKRIKLYVRKKNGHISAATNSAIKLAKGDFIALLDHDDVMWPNALYEIVKTINANPTVDLVYTDEDKIDETGKEHSYPFFKPDFSPEFLESCNYITHFSTVRKSIMDDVGGLRVGYEGAQDWDLFLRITEVTQRVVHIPKVLYSWRIHENSTAKDTDSKPYVYAAQRKLLADHVTRSGRTATVRQGVIKQHCSIVYLPVGSPTVTIILFGDGNHKQSAQFLQDSTTYKDLEVLSSHDPRQGFNGTNEVEVCNKLLQGAAGEFVILFDTSMRVVGLEWFELLLGDVQREGVGAVGGRTLTQARNRIMRAGVGIGIYGVAAPLLEFMSKDEMHYVRGLFGQSRRNVSAVDSGCTIFRTKDLIKVGGFNAAMADLFVVDACLKLLDAGKRNIYNPFIETVDKNNLTAGQRHDARDVSVEKAFRAKWRKYIENDPYLNPHYTLSNAQMGIR